MATLTSSDLVRQIEEETKPTNQQRRRLIAEAWKDISDEKAIESLKLQTWAELDAAAFMAKALASSAKDLTLRGDFDIMESLAKQVWDECRHARYCAVLVKELGGKVDSYTPKPQLKELYAQATQNALQGDLLSLHATNMLIGESATLAIFLGMKDACEETGRYPELLRVCRIVERDEMFHINNGRRVVSRYATTEQLQAKARAAADQWLDASRRAATRQPPPGSR